MLSGRRALSSPASFSGWIPGGDKTGDPNWYDKFVPIADDLFDQHLKGLKKEPEKRHRKEPTNRREGVTYGQEFQDSAGENVSCYPGTDMYISTLQHFVRAMGGELKITAVFPEGGKIEIKQFDQGKKAAAAS